jgi:GNAT superfamily N-acetyltransferase
MIYRPMQQSDVPQCMRLAKEGWEKFAGQVSQPEFMEMFTTSGWRPFFYVADDGGQLRGMAGWNTSWLTYGIYNLFWVAVQKDHRKQGIGKTLVERCLDDIRPLADAVMLMTGVPEFYYPWGFETVIDVPNAEGFGSKLMILKLKE